MRPRRDVRSGMLVTKAKRGGWLVPANDGAPIGVFLEGRDLGVVLMDGSWARIQTPRCVAKSGIIRIPCEMVGMKGELCTS